MAHECTYCGALCYCDCEDTFMEENSDCVGCTDCRADLAAGREPGIDEEDYYQEAFSLK